MFARIYESIWHHPVAFWLVGLPFLAYLITAAARRRERASPSFLLLVTLLFQVEVLFDAWLTSPLSPLGAGSSAATAAAVAFVILGDLRFFVLFERFGGASTGWLARALAWSLLVPVLSAPVRFVVHQGRVLFLVYELAFAALALMLRWVVLRRRALSPPLSIWLGRLTGFVLVQYLLWASADVLILVGLDGGHLLRLVPNAMYYALFLPFAWFSAPEELRA